MKIRINGKERSTGKADNLIELAKDMKLNLKHIVIEHNLNIIPRDRWGEVSLTEGDSIEIVNFVGGG
ncbi:MAG: sulfur carrier protein ThiS [Candidatus Omnitrophica bacterium]|nr:sulfur carrier protein ThiS [Candidatus Omnitrophota bacterium]